MSEGDRHSVSVAGVILDDVGRALLIQRRDNGHWEAPGGVLELAEDIRAGLKREVLEETGLRAQVDDLTGVYKNMKRGIIALVFRCRIVGGSARETSEAQGLRWMNSEEVRELATEAFAVRVLDAMARPATSPAVRHHDGTFLAEGSGDL
ncbi:NUDIX domain-containing protein [Actinomadura darangshiensis]|uniref:NUDIX domain-containing protein n=1 Tax=Actinomadura darangshiensis TaxID=705336 RepID=A0A4R5AJY7_9ACTN|nr:NUDIX domain-containing protein [Actinomadura darangshiensis]TDD72115.1 NUDIX domain-containing protein [Actinomadura darangshiensis]